MFDTMTATKIVGSLCGALLVFLLGKWAGEMIYSTGGGHGEDHAQGYVIETGGDDEGGGDAADDGPSLAELYAAADLGKGEKVFGKCKACHKLEDGANATGPYLYGVVGRDVAAASGFGYSGSLVAVADVWTPEELDAFLADPKGYAPGTTMGFSGLKKPEDRANVIAFLDQTDGDMTEMAMPEAKEEAPAEAEQPAEDNTAEEVTAESPSQAEVAPTNEAEAAAENATGDAAAEETAEGASEQPAEEAAEDAAAEEQAEGGSEQPAEEAAEDAATEEPAEGAAEEAAAEEPASGDASGFAAMVAEADVAKGEKVFKKCKACHALEDGANKVGPHLYNLLDRDIASVDGFGYSDALTGLDGTWTADELNAFLEKPKDYAPGTKMSFAGVRKEEERAAVIAYIQSAGQ